MPTERVPSPRSVVRARYWAAACARIGGVLFMIWSLPSWFDQLLIGSLTGNLDPLRNSWLWGATLGLAIAAAFVLFPRRLARFLLPMPRVECPECSYPLPEGADRCPECGVRLAGS